MLWPLSKYILMECDSVPGRFPQHQRPMLVLNQAH